MKALSDIIANGFAGNLSAFSSGGSGTFINVKDYGALGNGSTDDYAAIQAALDAAMALGSATVYFPAGAYRVDTTPQITDAKGINLRGEGPDNTTIRAGAFPAFKTTGWWRSIVEGLGFWCNGNTTGGAFQMDGHVGGQGEQGVTFQNCYFFGNYNSKYVFTNQLIAGGNGQGSENVWIGCGFAGTSRAADTALVLINGYNALQNTFIGCNFQSFINGVKITAGNADILHCGFQSTSGYDQIVYDGADLDASGGSAGDTVTMTGCRTESLRIVKGGGPPCAVSNFAHVPTDGGSWAAGQAFSLNTLRSGSTAAGNLKLYRVTTAGTTGGSAPAWPESGNVADGSVVWTQLEFDVFHNFIGRLVQGAVAYGCVHVAQVFNKPTVVEDVGFTRGDGITGWAGGSGVAPQLSNVTFFHLPSNTYQPLALNPSTYPGVRQTNPFQKNIGGSAIVSTVSISGTPAGEISLQRGGTSGWPAGNWWGFKGGVASGSMTFAQLSDAISGGATIDDGVRFFITDGTPGSDPLTGGGTGCEAIKQNGAWRAISMGSSAGGAADGDYGDITVSGSGASWAIDNGAVSLPKMADVAAGTVFYRKTTGTGAPEVQTLATLKTDLGLSGTNSGDQTSITGNAGTATALQTSRNFSISGGGISASAVGFDGSAVVVLNASVDAGHITLARMADLAANSFIGNNTGIAATPLALTGTQATALLDAFTTSTKGLAPASGGGTANFLRADGTWAAPAGGGGGGSGDVVGPASATDNAIARFDATTGKLIQSSLVSIDDSGNMNTPGHISYGSIATPTAPTAATTLFSKSIAGRHMPHCIAPVGIDTVLQAGLHGNSVFMFGPVASTQAPACIGGNLTSAGTLSMQMTFASANRWQATQRKRLQTAATAAARAGFRTAYTQWFRGDAAGFGGFFFRAQFGQNLNVNGAQCFVGLCASSAALATTAGAVGAMIDMIGVGFDTTDANTGNWQLFRNDGSGTATKVDLGADAARNTTHGFDLVIFCPPGAATEIFVRIVNLHSGVIVLDTSYTTDLPTVNTGLAFKANCNNGAVASAHNLELAKVYIESDY
jgi:hypothetical protein